MTRLVLLIGLLVCSQSEAESFDEIDFWVGEGNQRAALVIDWDEADGTGPSLVWGYRWDGAATGRDLVRAVTAADARLFTKLNRSPSAANLLYGFGYDRNGDENFSLSSFQSFDSQGFAAGFAEDGTLPNDPRDLYAEGFGDLGYWHYLGREPGGEWVSSNSGFATRLLEDGDWDAWVFTSLFDENNEPRDEDALISSRPDEALAAPAPHLPGDFNADGIVDAADYTRWRDTEGTVVVAAGAGADDDFSGVVDAADYAAWASHYGTEASASVSLPEPTAIATLIFLLPTLLRTPRERAS